MTREHRSRSAPQRGTRGAVARRIAALLAAATLLAACGQRGPLYLPDSRPAKKLALAPVPPGAASEPGPSTRSRGAAIRD